RAAQPRVLDLNREAAEYHVPDGHLVDDCIEPVDKKQFDIACLAGDLDLALWCNGRIRDGRSQRQSCPLESFGNPRSETAATDVSLVGKWLPSDRWCVLVSGERHLRVPVVPALDGPTTTGR